MVYLIVGLDPGITTAIVSLDLKGEIVNIYSSKNLKISDIIEKIRQTGGPIIIACDVKYPQNTIYKVSSKFNIIIFCPEEDLKVGEKERIVKKNFPYIKLNNLHERDALSAAFCAYKKYERLFNKVENHLIKIKKQELIPLVKKKLVLRQARNIADALATKEQKKPSKKRIKIKQEEEIKKLIIEKSKLIEEIKELEKQKPIIKTKILEPKKFKTILENKENLIKFLKKQIKKVIKEKEELENDIKNLKEIDKLTKNGFLVIKELKNLNEIFNLNKKFGLYKDIIYVEDLFYPKKEILKFLREKEISIIIYKEIKDKEKIENENFILLNCKDINIKGERIKYIEKDEISKTGLHKRILEKVISGYKKERQ